MAASRARAARPPAPRSTGSRTIADLYGLAAERFGEQVAARAKRDGAWRDTTYREAGVLVSETGRGLIDLGVLPGDRVALLCGTRPEWAFVHFAIAAAGGISVPVYPTNSPEECEWVLGDSGAKVVVCENAGQALKVVRVRERLPQLEAIVLVDPPGDRSGGTPLEVLRARGRARPEAELRARTEAVSPEDTYTIIYTSGTTGPPKGCVLTHGNYRSVVSMCEATEAVEPGEEFYLYLPLAHSYALLIQLIAVDLGCSVAYWTGDVQRIVSDLAEVRPAYLPSVPRIFEKIHALVTAHGDPEQIAQAVQVGLRVRALREAGAPVPPELEAAYEQADEQVFANVRAVFGARLRRANTGAAPIAKEILEFFLACGVPVLEGYGLTECATVATTSTLKHFRLGTVGRALPGQEIRIAEDGEVLLKGANVFAGYFNDADASFGAVVDGWLHTGDLGALDQDGYLTITGRKKDIIITAGGKNLTPANLENDLKQSRWISQAIMYGDRRPYPVALVTLDPEEIVAFAREHGLPEDPAALAREPRVRALVQAELDRANRRYAQAEQVKRFAILDHDLSQATGELTPTLKVKRGVVYEKYADVLDRLYR